MGDDATLRGIEFVGTPRGIAEIGAEKLEQVGQRCGCGSAGEDERVFVGVEGQGEVAFVDETLELMTWMTTDAGVVEVSASEKSEAGKMFGLADAA